MKKMGCTPLILLFLALSIVMTVILYFLINPTVQSMTEDSVVKGLGNYTVEKYNSSEFKNYTCYRQYKFESIDMDKVKDSQQLSKVTDEHMEMLVEYEANFSSWIKKHSVEGYSFDMSMVDESDYCHIYSVIDPAAAEGSERKYMKYSVYILDTETNIIHKLEYNQDLSK